MKAVIGRPWLCPGPLRAGDRIAVVAPSGPFDHGAFAKGIEFLRERFEVCFRDDILARDGYLAGDDARRLRELEEALTGPGIKAIVAVRGGFGATRLLQSLSAPRVRAAARWLVGFSDVTALHALWARAGVQSVHGAMVVRLGDNEMDDGHRSAWLAVLAGQAVALQGEGFVPGVANGVLVGGNLSVLAAMVGTPYFPPLAGSVLLLEDVGERPYRVDRMLTTLRQSGALAGLRGLALGSFSACDPGPDGVRVDRVVRAFAEGLAVPVVAGLPIGHQRDNHSLRFGADTVVDGTAGTLTQAPIEDADQL